MVDSINSIFELTGGLFVLLNVIRTYKDKGTKGVSMVAVLYFTLWGMWNLYYYPALGQWYSAIGATSVAGMNIIWLLQILYYRKAGRWTIK